MKQVLIRQGKGNIEEVPAPMVEAGTLLVRVDHSCISSGTEMSGVRSSSQPLWKRALSHPDEVKRAVDMVRSQGIARTRSVVENRLAGGTASGYSAAGTVIEVGEGVADIRPGDRVAVAGAGYAHHAEIVRVPRNLTVVLPEGLAFEDASTVTLGAIALQGVRRAQPTLGETFVVIGLGALGQLTVQLLRANGCHAIGTDLDRSRIEVAIQMRMDAGVDPEDGIDIEQVSRLTDGMGADGVIITAATPSDAVVSTAFQMCRKKGRVVLVGDVGLNLNRSDFYSKELDFFISSSYGPGRYDNQYEEEGLDYPVAFIRWTENRNMAEYLHLLSTGQVRVAPLVGGSFPIERAGDGYEALKNEETKPLFVLLKYPQPGDDKRIQRSIANPRVKPAPQGTVRIAIVGAGGFAKGMHIPNLQSMSDLFSIRAIMTRTGHNATIAARQYGAAYASTDYKQVLDDSEVDAVLLTTRHDLHASMTAEAIGAGKHVLVEKPLALTRDELSMLDDLVSSDSEKGPAPVVLTGFNRRFSPAATGVKHIIANRSNPMIVNYRMNAGHIRLDNWVHSAEGGGRNRGEACHIYDLFTFLTGARVVKVNAQSITPATGYYSPTDNFVATMSFDDGSVATLTYTALGARDFPKEQMEVFVDGKVLFLDDYKQLAISGSNESGIKLTAADKGHSQELRAFGQAIVSGGDWPIPWWQQVQATDIALRVEEQIRPDGESSPNGPLRSTEVTHHRETSAVAGVE